MVDMTISFPVPDEYLTLNKMPNTRWQAKKYRATKNEWKAAAHIAALAAFPGQGPSGRALPPCDVYISLPVWGRRTRDSGNWTATSKPILDGMIDAGLWPDDGPTWVKEQPITFREIKTKTQAQRSNVIVRLIQR